MKKDEMEQLFREFIAKVQHHNAMKGWGILSDKGRHHSSKISELCRVAKNALDGHREVLPSILSAIGD